MAMVSNARFMASIISTDSPRASGRIDAAALVARRVILVPSAFQDREQQRHDVCADREIGRVVIEDKGFEGVATAAGFESLRDQLDDIAAQRIHLAMKLDAPDTIAQIDQRRARILF